MTAKSDIDKYIGSRISIEMRGGMGYFQGTVVGINNTLQQLSLTDVIHDGRPTNASEMKFK